MKKHCENCGSSVEHFNLDYETGFIRCFYCNNILPAEMFFNDITINKFVKKIPELRRDEFLEKLGFEKKPISKRTIIIGFFAALIPLAVSLHKIFKKRENPADLFFAALPLLIVLIPAVKILLDGTDQKYVKKDKGIISDSR